VTAPAVGSRDHAAAIARGLAERLALLLRSADRLDALEERSGSLMSDELRADPASRAAVARQMVARLLRVSADPGLEPLIRALVSDGAQTMAALAERREVPRFVVARCVDDLVDGGLATRELGPDTVAPTPLAAALVDLLDELEEATAGALAERLTAGAR
jgi:hypothetical protein